jgi:MoxR-like ATPase
VVSQPEPDRSDSFADLVAAVSDNVGRVIQGKPEVIDLVVLCLVSEGHLLVEDVPGVGKTSLAKALATSIDCSFGRVQFTPDLLPSDVVGVNVWNRATSTFEFRPGPVFSNIVLGDEINRASPKTQSALLEAMAERQVTVDGVTHPLERPFMVIATQNPIEHEGTYPLPDSQLDRFLMRVSVGYPSRDAELTILDAHGDHDALVDLGPVITASQVEGMTRAVRSVHVADPLRGYLVDLANATRRHPGVAIGMSPRATLALQRVARALAAMRGRSYVVPDDFKELAGPVLAHRLTLSPEARLQGLTADDVVADVLQDVPIPVARSVAQPV